LLDQHPPGDPGQFTNSLVNAGKSRLGVGKASADSKSPAAGEEMLGDAENPTPSASQGEVTWKEGASSETGSVDSSTQAAVTSGAGQTRDEQAGGEEHSEGAVVGAATTDAGDSDEVAIKGGADSDGMVADAVDGAPEEDAEQVGSASFGQRLAAIRGPGASP